MHEMLILPFGILPLVLLAIYLVWKMLEATGQRTITNDRRVTTEFPTEVSALLCGINSDELVFNEDGKSVVLKIANAYRELPDSATRFYVKWTTTWPHRPWRRWPTAKPSTGRSVFRTTRRSRWTTR